MEKKDVALAPASGVTGRTTKSGSSVRFVVATTTRAPPGPASVPRHQLIHVWPASKRGRYTLRLVARYVVTGATRYDGPNMNCG